MRPIPVRLTPDQLLWLDSQLKHAGINRSTAIRICVAQAMAAGDLVLPTTQPKRRHRTKTSAEVQP